MSQVDRLKAEGWDSNLQTLQSSALRPPYRIEMIGDNLFVLSRARKPEDVDLPGFHLHPLKGEMKGLWAVTVRANWRVTFRIEEGEACDVNLLDYH